MKGLNAQQFDRLSRIARGIAAQFGPNCEVVVHEISGKEGVSAIRHIENGHVSGRKLGDGPSQAVLDCLAAQGRCPPLQAAYLTRTPDGRLLKSTTVYLPGEDGSTEAILGINLDISALDAAAQTLAALVQTADQPARQICNNVNDLLDDLIAQADALIGKPVALMTKEDKMRAIRYLNERGALLVMKSGDKIAGHFGISKYTLYSYLDPKSGGKQHD